MSTRFNRLADRIYLHNGQHLATTEGPNRATMDFFRVGSSVVIVETYADNRGVELFVCVTDNSMEALELAIDKIAGYRWRPKGAERKRT